MVWRYALSWAGLTRLPRTTVSEVFATGGIPSVTYVERRELGLEQRMADALERRHAFTIVSGPTKCGKSVVCQRVLGGKLPVTIQGGQVDGADDFWRHVAHKLGLPGTRTQTRTKGWSVRSLVEVAFGISIVAQKKLSGDGTATGQQSEAATFGALPVLDALAALRSRELTLIIEDFHYIDKPVQRAIVRALKSAVFEGLRVIILAVPHRAFDPADVENEVEGRVNYVEVPRWSTDDLSEIAERGFAALRLVIPPAVRRRICDDAFGNPLLVQEICYQLSRARLGTPESAEPADGLDLHRAYERVIEQKGLNRFDRFAQCTIDGGTPPIVDLRSGGQESAVMVLLASIASYGPKPITSYAEIREAFAALSRAEPPSPDRVGALCASMVSAVAVGRTAPMEWLPGTLELALTDPFLMFYMRWVLRDRRAMVLDHSAIESAVGVQPGRGRDNEVTNG